MVEFEKEDIVMLKNPNKLTIENPNQYNLYKIEKITQDGYWLEFIQDMVINKSEVLPVPINTEKDTKIYIILSDMADVIDINNPQQEIRSKSTETLSYMDVINNDPKWQECTKKLQYVHEVQRFFRHEVNPNIEFGIEQ